MNMASRDPRWLEFLAFAKMVKHFDSLGQTLSLHSADSFRCLVMPLSDLRISRAPSSEASSSEASSSDVVFFSALRYSHNIHTPASISSRHSVQSGKGNPALQHSHNLPNRVIASIPSRGCPSRRLVTP